MKRFKFSLQTVHNVREVHRNTAERALAVVAAELRGAHDQLLVVQQRRQSAINNYVLLQQANEIEAAAFASHTNYIDSLTLLERQARTLILHIEERFVSKREFLTEALRRTKTTANLRERQRVLHHRESEQLEQKLLDEMAVMASTRRLTAIGE